MCIYLHCLIFARGALIIRSAIGYGLLLVYQYWIDERSKMYNYIYIADIHRYLYFTALQVGK